MRERGPPPSPPDCRIARLASSCAAPTMWPAAARTSLLSLLRPHAPAAAAAASALPVCFVLVAAPSRSLTTLTDPQRTAPASAPPASLLPRLQHRAEFSIASNGAGSHDDFKPVQKGASVPSVQDHIEKDIKENAVLIYMKGVPEAPQCGFSAMVVRILDEYGVQYKARNVLTDPELRNAIKEYSNWPTIPQVYVNGEFVGGSDILISMHRSGELETLLKDVRKR